MRIGIIGSGDVGRSLAAGLRDAGHEIRVSSRTPERLQEWCAAQRISADVPAAVATFAELAVVATAWDGTEEALRLAGADRLAGKVVIDATNPLRFTDRLGLAVGFDSSGGELVQQWLKGARVVKAFNTVGWELMCRPDLPDGPPTLFIAGDDSQAKLEVSALAAQLGWGTHDCGGIIAARYTEPLAMIWIDHAIASGSRSHAFKLLGS